LTQVNNGIASQNPYLAGVKNVMRATNPSDYLMTYKELSRIAVKLTFLAGVKNVTRATNSFGLSDDVQS
jgi:hypothetical protein